MRSFHIGERAGLLLLLLAIAIAFADSSIVVLAVPEIIDQLDVDIDAASWVITAYNLAVVVAAALLLPFLRRLPPQTLAAAGFTLFALASVGCAAAPSFEVLTAFRTLQGLAAAPVLVAALPLLGRGGIARWTLAATVGLAAGPALGGLLTELFTWRAIFVAQAPLVAAGLLALRGRTARAPAEPQPSSHRTLFAHVALGALSAALVGALFLVVVLLVNGFGWEPLPAALTVTTLPVVAVAGGRVARELPAGVAGAVGSLAVAAGLVTLGLLPGADVTLLVAGLALCGAGLGLAAQPLGEEALSGRSPTAAAARTVLARHVGLVVALVVVTPLLVSSLTRLETDAEAVGGELVLQAPIPLSEKIPIITELARVSDEAETDLPDFEAALAPGGREAAGEVARLAEDLTSALRDLVARSFRSAFLVCALFGLLAAGAALPAGGFAVGRRRLAAVAAAGVLALGSGVALGADLRRGALDNPADAADPCSVPTAFRGGGVDATIQRVALASLAGAACELDTTRPALLRALVAEGPSPWSDERLEDALRAGLDRAITAEEERGTIGATTADLLRIVAESAPLQWVRDALSGLGN